LGQEQQAAARASGRASLDRPALALALASRARQAETRLARALAAVESASSPSLKAVASALLAAADAVRAPLEAVLAAADGGWALRPNLGAGPLDWRWEAAAAEGGALAPPPVDDVRR
jgi:hypothetical protein